MKNIDYALVEEKRPPMYTAMKYWGTLIILPLIDMATQAQKPS